MSPPTSRKFTLWGFKLPAVPEPQAFVTDTERAIVPAKRKLVADGWTAQYYLEGVEPVGLRNQARHAGPDPRILVQHTNVTSEDVLGTALHIRVRCLCGWEWSANTRIEDPYASAARRFATEAIAEHIDEQLHPEGAEDAAVSR